MTKIKILHIIKSLGRGGAEMLLPETLKLHNKSQFEFHYIYFLPWKDQMVPEIEEKGGNVSCFSANDNLQLMLKLPQVVGYCKKNQIQLIHCHLPWAGFLGRFIFKKTGIPVVYTEHNMQERYHWITRNINKLTFNWQTLALGVSEDVSSSILQNIEPETPVQTLLNGVNTDKYCRELSFEIRASYNIPEDAFVVGLVAVFRFQKRIKEWLEVFKRFSDLNENAYGIIVGAGPLEDEVIMHIKELNLEKRVFLAGLQTQTRPYYEAMDVFMMTSSFEGLPIALLEAMSMECAIVTTNAGGIKEVIKDGEDGLLFDVDNWMDMSSSLTQLYNTPDLLRELKISARRKVVDQFSLKLMVQKLENNYLKIVENADKGS